MANARTSQRYRESNAPTLWMWLGVSALVILADQITKVLILRTFKLGDGTMVTSFFDIVRVHNTGAAFSFLANASGWQRWFFVVLGLAASAFIIWMIKRHPGQKLFCFAVSMIMGGALGNVIDRLAHGYVVDMLQFRLPFLKPIFSGGYFPAFNLADAAITVGAVCLIVDEMLRVKHGD
jgi:signal peptidase II